MSRRWILPVVILVLLFTASLISVEPGTVGVLRGAAGGKAFILESGLHFRIPFLQRLMVYPAGPFRLDFPWEAVSREGVPFRVQVHFEGLLIRESLLSFSERAAGRNAPTVIQEDLEPWIRSWVSQRSPDDIPSQAQEIAGEFRAASRAKGFQLKSLTVARLPGEGPVPSTGGVDLLPRPVGGVKVVLIGLDGADWQVLDPLIREGKTPHLARLKSEGAWAELRSMDPMLSPLLWTTVATGRPPEEHGVIDFMIRDPGTGRQVPVGSAARRVRALWNIFTEAGLSTDVVAWWATWPAEPIGGTLVSDRVAYSLFASDGSPPPPGAVSPGAYADRLAQLKVDEGEITSEDLRPFVEVSREELSVLREQAKSDAALRSRNPVLHLTRILAGTRTYQAIALDLLSRRRPDFFALYYQGIDEVSHRFAHYADPKMAMVNETDHRKFRRAVGAFYAYQDRLLGEILARTDPGSLILVLSDHGFKSGASRPRDRPPDIEGQPARWHRGTGVFLAGGPMVAPGEKKSWSLLEVAPLILSAAGLPPAADMPGAARDDLFALEFASTRPRERIATYERTRLAASATPHPAGEDAASLESAEAMAENLRSLGYLAGGGSGPSSGTAFSHANLAGIYLQKGRLSDAEREAKEALRIAPGYLPALVYLAETYEKQGRFAEAIAPARQAAATDSPDRQSGIYLLLANLYVASGKTREGLAELAAFLEKRGAESDLHSAMGIVKAAQGDDAGAEGEYRKAMSLDPAAQEPVKRLFDLYRKAGQLDRLAPLLVAAMREDPSSAFHANYAGLALDQTGRSREAEVAYRRALENDPDYVGALVNLGGLLARQRRFAEAIPLLRRAVDNDSKSVEARVGLGAALSLGGRNDEAVAALEEGEKLGMASPALYNALAMAYFQQRRTREAIGTLKQSLKLDPDQTSARTLLAEWEKP